MARDVDVKLRLKGLNAFMRSEPIQKEVNRQAARLAANAGPKFGMRPKSHRWTARAYVHSVEGERLSDADVRRLLGAVGSSGS